MSLILIFTFGVKLVKRDYPGLPMNLYSTTTKTILKLRADHFGHFEGNFPIIPIECICLQNFHNLFNCSFKAANEMKYKKPFYFFFHFELAIIFLFPGLKRLCVWWYQCLSECSCMCLTSACSDLLQSQHRSMLPQPLSIIWIDITLPPLFHSSQSVSDRNLSEKIAHCQAYIIRHI